MFENIIKFFKKMVKSEKTNENSKETAKERLHLVLMQDRANVSADFLDLMRQEIIEVIKKYIDVEDSAIDVRLTNKTNEDGTVGAPALYANIPIVSIKETATISEHLQTNNNVKKVNDDKIKDDKKKDVVDTDKEKTQIKNDKEKDNKDNKKIKNDNDNDNENDKKDSEEIKPEEDKNLEVEQDKDLDNSKEDNN